MDREAFIRRNRPEWERLAELVSRIRSRGYASLSGEEVLSLEALYRKAGSDLSRVRGELDDAKLVDYLNELLASAHERIYVGRTTKLERLGRFVRSGYPALFRRHGRYVAAAGILYLLFTAIGFAGGLRDEAFVKAFIEDEAVRRVRGGELWTESIVTIAPKASSFFARNNITVALTAFALGITAGVGTLLALVSNGLALGAAAALTRGADLFGEFLQFLAPHGPAEATAFCTACGAGFVLASSVILPGKHRRLYNLRQKGREAVWLALGTVPVLFLCGVIEGFISPLPEIPAGAKYALSAVLTAALYAYLLLGGRKPRKESGGARP